MNNNMNTNPTNINTISNDNILKLKDFLYKDDNIMLAFIFGSFAAKRMGKNSDLDIAVLYENPPTGFEILREIDKLSKIAGMEAHLAILNGGSPLFKHQVMKNKINLVIKDEKFFGKFRENVISQYDEYKYISGMDKYDR
ncbi:MAG: hypothetical protein EVJ47_03560 [Candidatus Acidulodesulfobacterium ferriphilum]|jgi:predicted nucleotidyltransferase|uniref:Polymerase beta nucleotidyltransferase domain-containing protein n=1 Tax=Candidatus Acidulodesulfobacterium ferriphilum TaxID=2597223 RepID=A0A519BDK8_9DELT|nr:MAG: hypothetical protein EVJ47_03560 [Candidatus Acidulodesulfobacterium ferriphilum]